MNRIRALREERGLSALELAEKVGTTQPTISRLETGERQLTEDWMRRIAKALNVRPTDLIATATIADFSDELEPYIPDVQELTDPLAARGMFYFRTKTDSVELAGVPIEKICLFDTSKEAIEARKTGDVVMLRIYPKSEGKADLKSGVSLLRQFVAPGLFVTNRKGTNAAFTDGSDMIAVTIKGVMVAGRAPEASGD